MLMVIVRCVQVLQALRPLVISSRHQARVMRSARTIEQPESAVTRANPS